MRQIPRRAQRRDGNEKDIIKALEDVGVSVMQASECDLVCGWKGSNYLFEIKTEECVSKKTGQIRESEIKPSQKKLRAEWKGHYQIVWNIDQILLSMGIVK